MKKILYFVTEDWYFALHWMPLATAAKKAGHDVVIITRVRQHGEIIRNAGLGLVEFEHDRRNLNPFRELLVLARLWRIYRRERPDIVHHIALKPVVIGSVAARLAGVPKVINTVVGFGWLFGNDNKLAKLARMIAHAIARPLLNKSIVTVPNVDDHKWLRHIGVEESSLRIIRGPGVDPSQFLPLPESNAETPIVALIGRLLWDKGLAEFAAAASFVRQNGVQARFVLVGTPDPANPGSVSEEQLRAWEDSGLLELWGWRRDMPAVMSQANVICLPTFYREGLPRVLLEASACARAVIASNTPGCRDVVRHGVSGLLVPPRNARALADAVVSLLGSAETRRQYGLKARQIVEREFRLDRFIAETASLYNTGTVTEVSTPYLVEPLPKRAQTQEVPTTQSRKVG